MTDDPHAQDAHREETDQLTFQDPVTRYPALEPPVQDQPEPGLDAHLVPTADLGERSYRGTGRLEGRKALVTGGDSGIGAAVAIAFAREGADVALGYLPDEEADALKVKEVIEAEGRTAVLLPSDLTDPSAGEAIVEQAVEGLSGLDVLVNNAGRQIVSASLQDLPDEQVAETFSVNILAMFRITRAALAHLPPGSTIINTTSIEAYQPSPNLLDYTTTKAAINNFSKGLSQQLAPRGIRVNAVAPGPIWTPLQVSDGQEKADLPVFGHSTPLGRAGQPTELAPAYVFLASNDSTYITGEVMAVTGGNPI